MCNCCIELCANKMKENNLKLPKDINLYWNKTEYATNTERVKGTFLRQPYADSTSISEYQHNRIFRR